MSTDWLGIWTRLLVVLVCCANASDVGLCVQACGNVVGSVAVCLRSGWLRPAALYAWQLLCNGRLASWSDVRKKCSSSSSSRHDNWAARWWYNSMWVGWLWLADWAQLLSVFHNSLLVVHFWVLLCNASQIWRFTMSNQKNCITKRYLQERAYSHSLLCGINLDLLYYERIEMYTMMHCINVHYTLCRCHF